VPTWIRCRDPDTGAQFDVHPRSIRPGASPIAGYPTNSGPAAKARPAKPFRAKDGNPSQPKQRRPTAPEPKE
jgi:hypothetical protein